MTAIDPELGHSLVEFLSSLSVSYTYRPTSILSTILVAQVVIIIYVVIDSGVSIRRKDRLWDRLGTPER